VSQSSAEYLTEATRRMEIAMTRLAISHARELGIGVQGMLALTLLGRCEALGPSELAQSLQMTTGAMTGLVDLLEASGHVKRGVHPSDRWRVVLTLTEKVDDDITPGSSPVTAEFLGLAARLSARERLAVSRFLDRFIAIIERSADGACRSDAGRVTTIACATSREATPTSSVGAVP
jgi:DNA-binding MarR family transcriptional regulator